MIELRHVSFKYAQGQRERGLKDLNLLVKPGEVVLLCGESGCGKTTVTRLINGLIPNYFEGELTGEVLVHGERVHQLPLYETAKRVGSVFQNPRSQFFNVDTTSELAFGCENKGMPEEEIQSRIAETVDAFKIQTLMGRSIFQLSGGEKQKIACASVSTGHPDVYVLDEPSSNLDAQSIDDLRRYLAYWKKQGKTLVIAEHRLYFLRDLVDRVVYMGDGAILQEFSGDQVRRMSASDLAALGLRPLSLRELRHSAGGPPSAGLNGVRLSNFQFRYNGSRLALDVDDLALPRGGIIAVIGKNGAGKSTFARCLCGLEGRCKGRMRLDGQELRASERLKRCYLVMQDVNHQLFTESVLDEVLLSMEAPDPEKTERILKQLDLSDYQDVHPMSLSGGQKQRVAIASALVSDRDFLIYDEPTSGLDLRHMQEVVEHLKWLQEQGKTQFVISHDPEFILRSCSHALCFEQGRVVENYPLDERGREQLLDFFTRINADPSAAPED